MFSKALASRVKKVLPSLVLPQQMAHVENRFIGESGRFIADIIEITDVLYRERFLVAMDIEKGFDSLDHTFLISVLKRLGFSNNFVSWIETLISKQEYCIINSGNTTQYFHVERGARQGNSISAYIFILYLEVLPSLVQKLVKTFTLFSSFSALKSNISKCEVC